MGIFSFLFGSNETGDASPPRPASENLPTPEEFEDRLGWFAAQLRVLGERCEQVGLRVDRAGETCELRAIWRGHPISVELDPDGRGSLELGFVNRRGHFCLIGQEGETIEGDFRREPNETVNLAIATGISLQSSWRFLEDDRATFEGLPDATRAWAVQLTRDHWGAGPIVRHQRVWVPCAVWPAPERSVASTLEDRLAAVAELADLLADGPAPVESRAGGSHERVACGYCETRFVLERADPRCPSCGAAAQ